MQRLHVSEPQRFHDFHCHDAHPRYTMDYVKEAGGKWDEVVESHGVKVFIDPRALLHIVGSTMDFVDDHVGGLTLKPAVLLR